MYKDHLRIAASERDVYRDDGKESRKCKKLGLHPPWLITASTSRSNSTILVIHSSQGLCISSRQGHAIDRVITDCVQNRMVVYKIPVEIHTQARKMSIMIIM